MPSKIILDTQEMRTYSKAVKDVAQSLAQQCNKLSNALEEAKPFIKVGSGASAASIEEICEAVDLMMGQLPAIEDTGDIADKQAALADEIANLLNKRRM